jgi:hypothetical protein
MLNPVRRSALVLVCAVMAAAFGFLALSPESRAQDAAKQPAVLGDWTGTWGVYSPPGQEAKPAQPYPQMRLDCKVAQVDGKWQATFEGECGRPYKYTIKMLGRRAGDVVMFQGTADLGPMDGGVYDWIGRATDKEFVGFYTSQKYTGHFRLSRPK